ncbi:hypothetical protein [Polynucleobacter sp. JS-Polo-80-F4]|uniref:hypothetical protein n=1 Tax=Polynucleobacter sp. JS-Polo-80-F4 TaxID=2576918 RepID=UPI001C0CE04E|nr:hypothetical protein [Polynucleobacter sp. JS-Polo-80-F4]MBU3617331.1 hypothetical protein [Polynucleobacter sp. JS-Polo-80-F4]
MNIKKAFVISLSLFLLILLSLWVSKLLNYPPPLEVIYDQDAVINGVWRWLTGLFGFSASVLLFILLALYVSLKRMMWKKNEH